MARLFDDRIFSPGKVRWNELNLDRTKPLEEQIDNLHDDAIWVEFSDVVSLHVGWRPSFRLNGEFYVIISRNRDDQEFNPVQAASCRSIAELEALVANMVQTARDESGKN